MIKKSTVMRIIMLFFLCFSWIIQKDAQAKHVAAIFYKIIEQSENQIMCSLCKHNCMVNKQQMTGGVLNNHWYDEYYYNTADPEHKFCENCFYKRCLTFHIKLVGSKLKNENWNGCITDLSKYTGIGLVLKILYGDSAAKCIACNKELVQDFLNPDSGFCFAHCKDCPRYFHRDCTPTDDSKVLPKWISEWQCNNEIIKKRSGGSKTFVLNKRVIDNLNTANFKDDFLKKYDAADTDEKFNMMREYYRLGQ